METIAHELLLLPKGTRVADRLIFIGLAGCLQCTYLLPVVQFAQKAGVIKEIIIDVKDNKEDFEKTVFQYLEKLKISPNFLPFPIPFIYIEIGQLARVTQQHILEECASGIRANLTEEEEFEYLDNECQKYSLLLNYLTKIVTDTVF